MELTPESCSSSRKRAWLNMPFTIVWQSSNVPSIASAWTFGDVDRRHLPALDVRHAAMRVEDEDIDLIEALEGLDGGAARIARGRADDRGAGAARP